MIQTGLIGYGFGGSVFHAPLICAEPRLQLASVVTGRRDQLEKDLPGVRAVDGVEELLLDPKIQLVVVSSPSPTHFEIARAALMAGKHVVVDKPFANTVQEAEELISLAVAKNLFLSVFQNRRLDGDFLTVKRCIQDGLLGKIYHYESHFDRFRPAIKPGWKEEAGPGTGILYDLGAHLIDQALQLFGMPETVTADVFPQRPGALADDYFHLVLAYPQMRAILHGSVMVRKPGPRFVVHGDAGTFMKYGMDVQEAALIAGRRPGDAGWGLEPPECSGEFTGVDEHTSKVPSIPGAYERYYRGVAEALLDGAPAPVDPADAREALIVLAAALTSAAEKRTISAP